MHATTAAAQSLDDAAPMPGAAGVAPAPNPIAVLVRAMRGRWLATAGLAVLLAGALGTAGYLTGSVLYESQAILRVFPQESNILYATGDDSVLKTFDSFVKAETSYVASHPVMARATETLRGKRPDLTTSLTAVDLGRSIEIRRNDSLIVLTTRSREAAFAAEKLDAVVSAYMTLTDEAEAARSAVRLSELRDRENDLVLRLSELAANQLEIGGEFGVNAIAKAHAEKISQIDQLAGRLSEVEATIATLQSNTGSTGADISAQEIMRATLLDRTMADLGFEMAKLESELAGLRADFDGRKNSRFRQLEKALIDEIAVIQTALDDRREQIRVLGQTGALTDAKAEGSPTSLADVMGVRDRIAAQLANARAEARDLNRRRLELDRVEREIEEVGHLLAETRRALEVIRLESGRALPGYMVLMSPPSVPSDPADDSRKTLAAGGVAGGVVLAALAILGLGLRERRIRFAETLTPVESRVPVIQVSPAGEADADAADRLRNALQLHPLRYPRLVGMAPVIAVTRAETGPTATLARALAESYAGGRMRTLLIEADVSTAGRGETADGWSDVLSGALVEPLESEAVSGLWELPVGHAHRLGDRAVTAPMVRQAIDRLARSFEVIILSTGSLADHLAVPFLLAASDVGVLALRPSDGKAAVLSQMDRLDSLPRNGSVAVLRHARSGDPWIITRR